MKVATIIGANGTMGKNVAAILASFGNMQVYMIARSMEKAEEAVQTVGDCVKASSIKKHCIPADYDMLKECIEKSDFIFESVQEEIRLKKAITEKIGQYAKAGAIIATGTSGLSVEELSESLPEMLKKNYMGIHFFNPPYKMTLCELIPTRYTSQNVLQKVKDFMGQVLYRTTVVVKNTPAFLGNRIGFQFINEAMQCAQSYQNKGGIDYIDAILGGYTGRAMAPLATADYVGLDIHKAIVDNVYENTNDYAKETFKIPSFCSNLIHAGLLGRKSGSGLYKKSKREDGNRNIKVYDIAEAIYREQVMYQFTFKEQMIKSIHIGDYESAAKQLVQNESNEAEICLQFLLRYILYAIRSSFNLQYRGGGIRSGDDVMATGFGWCPPLAMIDFLGGKQEFLHLVRQHVDANLLQSVDLEKLEFHIEPSSYDYRKYILARR